MVKKVKFKNGYIRFVIEGKGTPIVLLHGYLESLEIWDFFSHKLSKDFSVIRIDLPGHGESSVIDSVHTMDLLAEAVKYVLDSIGIEKCILFGHSLGGYVTLAFADKYPNSIMGYSLFHSTPFADTEEKKNNRDREIELIKQGRKDLIVNTNIPKSFATQNIATLKEEINRAKRIAEKTSEEGIIAILEGMKQRQDRNHVIKNLNRPFLWILGRKDNYILFDWIENKIEMNKNGEIIVLEYSGHMGFIEQTEKSIEEIVKFIKKCG